MMKHSIGYYASKIQLQTYWFSFLAILAVTEFIFFFTNEKDESDSMLELVSTMFNMAWVMESVSRSFRAGNSTATATEEMYLRDLYKKRSQIRTSVIGRASMTANTSTLKDKLEAEVQKGKEEERKEGAYYLSAFVVSFIATFLLYVSLLPLSVVEPYVPTVIMDRFHLNEDDATDRARYSFGFLVLRHLADAVSRRAKAKAVAASKKLAVRTTRFAIRNPRKFKRRMNHALTYLRWVKYLAPLVGASNKLKGNAVDLYKKFRQYQSAYLVRNMRRQNWKRMTPAQREESAVLKIQSTFRARQSRKSAYALRIFSLNSLVFSVIKVQKAMRQKAARARLGVQRNKNELWELERRHFGRDDKMVYLGHSSDLTMEEKMRMMDLRESLRKEHTKESKYGMLMRPNTSFLVTWKMLFVFTILMEILQIVATSSSNSKTGKKLSLEEILSSWFLPPPECMTTELVEEPPKGIEKLIKLVVTFFKNIKETTTRPKNFALTLRSADVCEPLTEWQLRFFTALQLLVLHFSTAVGIVMFLDVFINFFTAEINPNNGVLQPKPFFPRWIVPGIVLQLMVNPQMKNLSSGVQKVLRFATYVGPTRFLRWILVLSPCLYRLGQLLINWWTAYASKENHNELLSKRKSPSFFL